MASISALATPNSGYGLESLHGLAKLIAGDQAGRSDVTYVEPTYFEPEVAIIGANATLPQEGQPWVFFDADNTLWHIEHLYDEARQALIERMADEGFDRAAVEATQRQIDHAAFREFGYSSRRFPLSFVRTLLTFNPRAGAEEQDIVRRIGEKALSEPAKADPDAVGVLNALKPRYCLGLVTAGDKTVQQRRLGAFPQAPAFDHIWIPPRKSERVFDDICRQVGADREHSWVVGDSIQSDMIPGHAAGLNTVLVRNTNWQEIEAQGDLPYATIVAPKLRDIVKIIS